MGPPRTGDGAVARPPRIVVYRRPLSARADSEDELSELVFEVVVEEFARLLGVNPEDVDPGFGDDEMSSPFPPSWGAENSSQGGPGAAAMAALRTGGSRTVVSALATGSIAWSVPPVPLALMTRPAYTGPEPGSGVITTANGVPLLAPGSALSVTTAVFPGETSTIWVVALSPLTRPGPRSPGPQCAARRGSGRKPGRVRSRCPRSHPAPRARARPR